MSEKRKRNWPMPPPRWFGFKGYTPGTRQGHSGERRASSQPSIPDYTTGRPRPAGNVVEF